MEISPSNGDEICEKLILQVKDQQNQVHKLKANKIESIEKEADINPQSLTAPPWKRWLEDKPFLSSIGPFSGANNFKASFFSSQTQWPKQHYYPDEN